MRHQLEALHQSVGLVRGSKVKNFFLPVAGPVFPTNIPAFYEHTIESVGCGKINKDVLDKFQSAMKTFYEKRQRPKDRRMLIPTLSGIVQDKKEFFEKTREFVSTLLIMK